MARATIEPLRFRVLVPHEKVQGGGAAGSAALLGGRECLPADSAPAMSRAHVKLGEERVAPAVLQVVSPGDDGVPRRIAVDFEDEHASESRIREEALEPRPEEGAVEGDAFSGVEVLHHLEERREVFAASAACSEGHAPRYPRSSANCSCRAPR